MTVFGHSRHKLRSHLRSALRRSFVPTPRSSYPYDHAKNISHRHIRSTHGVGRVKTMTILAQDPLLEHASGLMSPSATFPAGKSMFCPVQAFSTPPLRRTGEIDNLSPIQTSTSFDWEHISDNSLGTSFRLKAVGVPQGAIRHRGVRRFRQRFFSDKNIGTLLPESAPLFLQGPRAWALSGHMDAPLPLEEA